MLPTSCDITAFAEGVCDSKIRSAYEAYTSKGKPGLINYLYTDYLTGSTPGVYCYAVNGTDTTESIAIGSYLGTPTAVPGETVMSVADSMGASKAEVANVTAGWAKYYDDAENLCCGRDKAWVYCSPQVGGCDATPTYTYTNQTQVGALLSSDGETGDGTIFCGCELGQEAAPFDVDRETVQRVLADVAKDMASSAVRATGLAGVAFFFAALV